MQLTGPQQGQLEEILLHAFPKRVDVARMVRDGLDQNLNELVSEDNLRDIVFQLIEWTRAHNKIGDLLTAALKANPDDPPLREFAAQMGDAPQSFPENSLAPVALTWEARRDLYLLLKKTLTTTDQLVFLCIVLGVRYAKLEGGDLEAKIESLLREMEQQRRVADLAAATQDQANRQEQVAAEEATLPIKVTASLIAAASKSPEVSPRVWPENQGGDYPNGVSPGDELQEYPNGVSPGDELQKITNIVSRAIQPAVAHRLAGALVLWVADNPNNNVYERQALEPLGIRFMLSTSTEDALQKINTNTFDVIIADMGRPPDRQADYTLLEKIRNAKIITPFIIYAGSDSPQNQATARSKGALGSTNSPQDLFQLVTTAILTG